MILDAMMESKSTKEIFKAWHFIFTKEYSYASEEAKLRYKIFKENLQKIKEFNAKEGNTYKAGLNQFSDMTNEEFNKKMIKYKHFNSAEKYNNKLQESSTATNNNSSPKFIPLVEEEDDDLTKRNLAYTAINYQSSFNAPRNQGNCGGCWAFSVTGALEANIALKYGKVLPYLSVQQLLDCNSANYGCNGGDLITGYNYVLNSGAENDSAYSYMGYSGNYCNYNSNNPLSQITGYQYCSNLTNYKCSTSTVYTLLSKGPLSVVTNGGSFAFQTYAGGLFSAPCYNIDHAVVLAGYGVSGTTQYWLVRNSWGSSWGENGYIRIVINPANNYSCFIEYEAVLPIPH